MPILVKTRTGLWKATVRKLGHPTAIRLFQSEKDAAQWALVTKNEMRREVFVRDMESTSLNFKEAILRYLDEVSAKKTGPAKTVDLKCSEPLIEFFGKFSLAEITPDLVLQYKALRANKKESESGRQLETRSHHSLRLELKMLQDLFTFAVKEWGVALSYNPVFKVKL